MLSDFLEAPPRFELGHKGFADLCLTTWLWRHIYEVQSSEPLWSGLRGSILTARRRSVSRGSDMPPACHSTPLPFEPGDHILLIGADYGARTRHLDLGKVALYQMS